VAASKKKETAAAAARGGAMKLMLHLLLAVGFALPLNLTLADHDG
jgi:hypothetical protein